MESVLHVRAFEDNYIWLIRGHSPNQVAIVDPGDADAVCNALDRLALVPIAILCTHHHWDHTNGNQALAARYAIPIYGPANENIAGVTHALREGDEIALDELGLAFTVLELPGHTLGHIAFYGAGMLFCGDTLFSVGCGRLFEGTAAQMHDSLMKLADLPDATHVYCGHEYTLANIRFARNVEPDNTALLKRYDEVTGQLRNGRPSLPSTIGAEKATNPFLRADSAQVRANAERHVGAALDTELDVFAALRRWKDNFRG